MPIQSCSSRFLLLWHAVVSLCLQMPFSWRIACTRCGSGTALDVSDAFRCRALDSFLLRSCLVLKTTACKTLFFPVRCSWKWSDDDGSQVLKNSSIAHDFYLLPSGAILVLELNGRLILCEGQDVDTEYGGPQTTLHELETLSDQRSMLESRRNALFDHIQWKQQTQQELAGVSIDGTRLKCEVSGDEVVFRLEASLPPSVTQVALLLEDLTGETVVVPRRYNAMSAVMCFALSLWHSVLSSVFSASVVVIGADKHNSGSPPVSRLCSCGWYSLIDAGIPFAARLPLSTHSIGVMSTMQLRMPSSLAEDEIDKLLPNLSEKAVMKVESQVLTRGTSRIIVLKSIHTEALLATHVYLLHKIMKKVDEGWLVDLLSNEEELDGILKELEKSEEAEYSVLGVMRQRIKQIALYLSLNSKLSSFLL